MHSRNKNVGLKNVITEAATALSPIRNTFHGIINPSTELTL
jgi:hypothetical protein